MEAKLKPTMVVETGTQGNRLIDQSTGRAATISRTEALILSLTDGRHTPAQIATEATRLGTPLMVGDVQRALQRFEKAGILKPKEELAVVIDLHASDAAGDDPPTVVSHGPASTHASAAPEELDPNRPLPPFRQDLQVRRSAQKAVFDTLDPQSGKSFPLYDFEVSLARMMDGRRTAAQVLETGSGLGISVNLESLGKFVRQLQAYGFLGEPLEPEAAAPPPRIGGPAWGQTWERRDAWEDAVRTLFRTGLRMLRLSKPAEAKQYFSAVLESAPDNQEAREMLAVAEAALGSQKIPPIEGSPGPQPSAAAVVTEPALAATAPDAPALGSDPALDEKLRALESLSGPHAMPTAAQLRAGSPRGAGKGWLPWTIALLAVAGAVGYGAWVRRGGSVPDAPKIPLVIARTTGPTGRSLMAAGYVSAAHLISVGALAGRVKAVAVTVGQRVQTGTVLVELDDSEQQAQAKLARARVRD
ncbi:MAG TPA: biotin/lipoyl-binding protein, partial [Myxococcaceae bacterium]|nr:biotin/lipoyl-binding protein [Myxococcaceae bacterium]